MDKSCYCKHSVKHAVNLIQLYQALGLVWTEVYRACQNLCSCFGRCLVCSGVRGQAKRDIIMTCRLAA